MTEKRKRYSVKQVSDLSGVSKRTLHYYDQIGLLTPAVRTEKKYRYYSENDLLRLQQILFHRELDFSLEQTRDILDDPEFDYLKAMKSHRKKLLQRQEQLDSLVLTLDKTIEKLEGDLAMKMDDKNLYEGFDKETIDRWNREVEEKYDPEIVAESRRNVNRMSKAQFDAVKNRGEEVTREIAARMALGADSEEVQKWIREHHRWIENFYACSPEMYRGLGQLYIQNPEFTEYYETIQSGLAAFMAEAVTVYADNMK